MRAILTAALIWIATSAAMADEPAEAIQSTISGQITAFLADDFAAAFEFASPTIKQIFGTSERFGQMVRQGFPMVWRPADVRFLDLRDEAGRLIQRVMIRDGAGQVHLLDYQMIQTEKGWQINGVALVNDGDAQV